MGLLPLQGCKCGGMLHPLGHIILAQHHTYIAFLIFFSATDGPGGLNWQTWQRGAYAHCAVGSCAAHFSAASSCALVAYLRAGAESTVRGHASKDRLPGSA